MLKKLRKLTGSLLRGRYSSDFGAQLVVYALQIISGVLVGAYVARYLGPSKLGIMSLLMSVTAIVAPLLDLGTRQVIIKMLAQEDRAAGKVFWTVLLVKLALSTSVFAILAWACLAGFFGSLADQDSTVVLIGLGTILLNPFSQFENALIAAVKNRALMVGQIANLVIYTVMRAACVFFAVGLDYFLAAYFFSILFGVLNFWYTSCRFKLIPRFDGFDFSWFTKVLAENWPLIVSSIAISLYMRTDILMIEYFLTEKEVGHYWVANRLVEILFVIPVALNKTLTSKIYQRLKHASGTQERLVMRAFFQLIGSGCVLAGVLAFVGGLIFIPLLYGEDYAASVPVFCLSLLALPAVGLGVARGSWLVHFKRTKVGMYATLTGLATNIVLNTLLIPKWGIIGASVATVVGQYVSCVLTTAVFIEKWLFKEQVMSLFRNPMWGFQYLRSNGL